ncbi:MAG: KUP/HAK/KT family potassium transporter [Polyangia bacterium]
MSTPPTHSPDVPSPVTTPPKAPPRVEQHAGTFALAAGAVGIVFGDIGTSPLYTLKVCLQSIVEHTHQDPTRADVLGVLSLIFWGIALVVTVKYLAFVMRADHHGEGGIFALLGMVPAKFRPMSPSKFGWVPILVIIGAALLYGDGAITPAISVLSAVEGLKLAAPSLTPYTVQITCAILLLLFYIQSHGTATVGKLFGPIMSVWFVTIAVLGAIQIAHHPSVLWAVSPLHALHYFQMHGVRGATILGAVVLAVTGGEALYADMGHFGRVPIRLAWVCFVWPALLLSYFGQAALVLSSAKQLESPFFEMAPRALLVPLVILSSFATVIASQALISGAYSLTRQAGLLGFMPRLGVRHTSEQTEGQIYMPQVNWFLAVACILIVVTFGSSDRLASAYGLAVTGTMAITSIVFGVVAIYSLKWRPIFVVPLVAFFLAFDIPFLGANLTKFVDGGWLPALIGALLTGMMLLWARGRRIVHQMVLDGAPPIDTALPELRRHVIATIPGTAVMLAASDQVVPPVLVQFAERFHVLHERIVLLNVVTEPAPYLDDEHRGEVRILDSGAHYVRLHFGFMEIQDVPAALIFVAKQNNIAVDPERITYFIRRENVIAGPGGQMGVIAETMFAFLLRNATPADKAFLLPPLRVIELGWQIDL